MKLPKVLKKLTDNHMVLCTVLVSVALIYFINNYSASKSALSGLTKSIAAEVASRGITCNLIAPGFISTPMTDKLSEDQKNNIIKNIPIDRLGKPSDISSGCLYLSSNEASFVTGTTLHINGGMSMI